MLLAGAMMTSVRELRRITIKPDVMGGKPSIRGMRVTVGMIVEAVASGRSIPDLLTDFPYLEEEDIREALSFAASWRKDARYGWPVEACCCSI